MPPQPDQNVQNPASYRFALLAGWLAVSVLGPVSGLRAQDLRPLPRNVVEFGTQLHRYSDGIDPWNGIYVRTQIASGARNLWVGEVVAEDRFGEQAFSYGAGYVLDAPTWFGRAGLRTSTSGIFNPEWRADLRLGTKLLPARNLLVMGSAFRQKVRDGHTDTGLTAEAQYYGGGWILQGAVRWTHSNPGDVWARYHDAALTVGRYGNRTVTLHGAFGHESYQVIGSSLNPIGQPALLDVLVDFDSWMAQLTWREWLGRKVGVTVSGIYYENDFYTRTGVEAGVFIHFNGR